MESTAADFEDFSGLEFNWFALDNAGVIGLFSTAGYGKIPVEVLRHAQAHRAISHRLEVANYGTSAVWQSYGKLGLFVFDWQYWKGPYLKEASPSAAMKAELKSEILAIPSLPRLDLRFGLVLSVAIPRFGA